MNLFKWFFKEVNECNHEWKTTETSNMIQLDDMGYPLMLVIQTCTKCGKTQQVWLDVSEKVLDESNRDKYMIVEWKK